MPCDLNACSSSASHWVKLVARANAADLCLICVLLFRLKGQQQPIDLLNLLGGLGLNAQGLYILACKDVEVICCTYIDRPPVSHALFRCLLMPEAKQRQILLAGQPRFNSSVHLEASSGWQCLPFQADTEAQNMRKRVCAVLLCHQIMAVRVATQHKTT